MAVSRGITLWFCSCQVLSSVQHPFIMDSDDDGDEEPLNETDAFRYRAMAARANYLAADRTDLMYSVKEVCRSMPKPTASALKTLKWLGRYLVGNNMPTTQYVGREMGPWSPVTVIRIRQDAA